MTVSERVLGCTGRPSTHFRIEEQTSFSWNEAKVSAVKVIQPGAELAFVT